MIKLKCHGHINQIKLLKYFTIGRLVCLFQIRKKLAVFLDLWLMTDDDANDDDDDDDDDGGDDGDDDDADDDDGDNDDDD